MFPTSPIMVEQVAPTNWEAWVKTNHAAVLDVREPFEWAMGTLPDSELISLPYLPGRLGELSPDTPVLVVCRTGNRSMVAAQFLLRNGFSNPANLYGGLAALGLAE